MYEHQGFNQLMQEGRSNGEVVSIKELIIGIRGLEGVSIYSLVMFENGSKGLVTALKDQVVEVLALSSDDIQVGMVAVLDQQVYKTPVGEGLVGRIVDVMGQPLDNKGAIEATGYAEVFASAPGIIERSLLDKQLVSGVTIVDSLFPFVLGQRLAVLGDSKTGKSTFLRQLSTYQAQAGQIIVYVLIAKRQVDVDTLIAHLESTGAMKQTVLVVASTFEPLSLSYVAPYVGCAIAEELWRKGKDVVIIYDDLTSHAKAHRELSLLAEMSPGRDSYPGNTFYAHSSLLERAGKLAAGGGTLTALPVILTPSDDITAYLPTSVMSITDGQIIFDQQTFRKGVRPAVNVGLSVSRVGGRVQSVHWKRLTSQLFRKLADYRQAVEFAQFGSELAPQTQADLVLGKAVYEIYRQMPKDLYSLEAQYLMLATVIASGGGQSLNVPLLKKTAIEKADQLPADAPLDALVQELLATVSMKVSA